MIEKKSGVVIITAHITECDVMWAWLLFAIGNVFLLQVCTLVVTGDSDSVEERV